MIIYSEKKTDRQRLNWGLNPRTLSNSANFDCMEGSEDVLPTPQITYVAAASWWAEVDA
jgi:hypothetical protein